MTLNEIENVDKELLAARYEAAITEEFGSVAEFLELTIAEMIAKSRADGRVFAQGSKFFLKTDEIVTEYDYEMELLSQIRREGGKALISSYANSLTDDSFQIAELISGRDPRSDGQTPLWQATARQRILGGCMAMSEVREGAGNGRDGARLRHGGGPLPF